MTRPHMTRDKWFAIGIIVYIVIMFTFIFLGSVSSIFLAIGGGMGIFVGVIGIIGCVCAIIYDESTGLN